MTEDEIRIANKTARSAGAVGKNALLPRIIKEKFDDFDLRILDFGSGPKAIQTKYLKEFGFRCLAYDIGDNFDPDIHMTEEALDGWTFDIVMASNVINTLSSFSAVEETLEKIYKYTSEEGVALINYPTSPRKCKELTNKILTDLCGDLFRIVNIHLYNSNRVLVCYKKPNRLLEKM